MHLLFQRCKEELDVSVTVIELLSQKYNSSLGPKNDADKQQWGMNIQLGRIR